MAQYKVVGTFSIGFELTVDAASEQLAHDLVKVMSAGTLIDQGDLALESVTVDDVTKVQE